MKVLQVGQGIHWSTGASEYLRAFMKQYLIIPVINLIVNGRYSRLFNAFTLSPICQEAPICRYQESLDYTWSNHILLTFYQNMIKYKFFHYQFSETIIWLLNWDSLLLLKLSTCDLMTGHVKLTWCEPCIIYLQGLISIYSVYAQSVRT